MGSEITIRLSEESFHRLVEAARRLGRTPEDLAADLIAARMGGSTTAGFSEPKSEWVEGEPPRAVVTTPADYDGPYTKLDDALADFDVELERRLASRIA